MTVLTDNKNRAAAEIRNIFKKNNSELGQSGSVMRNFERKGQILLPKGDLNEDVVMMLALDAGADDVNADDEGFEILTAPSAFADVCDALNKAGIETGAVQEWMYRHMAGIETTDAEVKLLPMATTPVSDLSQAKAINKFIAALEDNEDVQNVYTTADFSDEIEAALAAEEE